MIYFAHPIQSYGTHMEQTVIDAFRDAALDAELFNPRYQPPSPGEHPMNVYLQRVREARALVFLPYGKTPKPSQVTVTRGVSQEITEALANSIPVWAIALKLDEGTYKPMLYRTHGLELNDPTDWKGAFAIGNIDTFPHEITSLSQQ